MTAALRTRARPSMRLTAAGLLACLSAACGFTQDSRPTHLGGDAEAGRALVVAYGCAWCHAIPDVPGGNSRVGPPLWGMADRGYIGGVLPNTEEAMVRWLINPRAMATRTAMPNLYVTEAHARDMTAFLYTLRAEPVIVRMVRGYLERATGFQSEASLTRPTREQTARAH